MASPLREPFKKRRCPIPADGFFEWTKVKPKTRYRFETGGPFVIAGVWDAWGKEETIESVAMITTRANAVLGPIHDRMPLSIPRTGRCGSTRRRPGRTS